MPTITIPFYKPDLSGREEDYLRECISSTWLSWRGRFVGEFESGFARFVGVRFASATCNGTAALHLALQLLRIGPGDQVIVPALSYVSAANAVTYIGAQPVFADCESSTWLMSTEEVARLITADTRAVIAVHLYGGAGNVRELQRLCSSAGVCLIEDCAQALGTRLSGTHVGCYSDVATFSFFANKTITTAEGGMVVTDNPSLNAECNAMKNMFATNGPHYGHTAVGYNYRMTNVAAALGLAQLERIQTIIARKRHVSEVYRTRLQARGVVFQASTDDEDPCWWANAIMLPNQRTRDRLMSDLLSVGIEVKGLFQPLNTLPPYRASAAACPVATEIWSRGVCLPSYPTLTKDEIERVCQAIEKAL